MLSVARLHEAPCIALRYNLNISRYSIIDQFIVSANVYVSFISTCSVKHDGDNLSDHDPIMLSLDTDWGSVRLLCYIIMLCAINVSTQAPPVVTIISASTRPGTRW